MRRRLLAALALVALSVLLVPQGIAALGAPIPVLSSPNVSYLTTVQDTQAISGEFSVTGAFFYTSSLDSIQVLDISNPKAPSIVGVLPNIVFENEAMTYGERVVDGELQQFVLVGADIYDVPPTDPARGNILGGEVYLIDVTDPTDPHIRSQAVSDTSTHTVQCVTVSCEYAYTAGDRGEFSIMDLRNLDEPVQLKTTESPAAKSSFDAGHYWDIDAAGLAWHTGGGGTAVFDVTDPENPVALNGTNELGTETPWNDFIHHNSFRPNGDRFASGTSDAPPSLAEGNVVLVTEEDYFDDGDEVDCTQAGTFQTWSLPSLDGEAYRAGNPDLVEDKGSMAPIDMINPVLEGDGLDSPVAGFCSAHWFDYHASGIVAEGFYQQGVRFIDVRDPADLKQFGFFRTGASQVWDAYWVPERDADGVLTGNDTNIVYAVDLTRGIDVLEVTDLPPVPEPPVPSETPMPSETPNPTESPQPSESPNPSESPEPSESPSPSEGPDEPVEVDRADGESRIETAVKVSEASYPEGTATVVVARADDYPDALAGGPLAFSLDAPILLTSSAGLDPTTATEIERLGADQAILLGGTAALSQQVEDDLVAADVGVRRVQGPDRFATAAAIAGELDGSEVYITEGADSDPTRGWPDALAVSPLAAHRGTPILLVTTESLPQATRDALSEAGEVSIVGGEAAVSAAVEREIDQIVSRTARIAGNTRYETAQRLTDQAEQAGLDASSSWFATGQSFADALVGGPAVAADGGILMLVDGQSLDNSPPTRSYLENHRDEIRNVHLLGGTNAISTEVENQIRAELE